MSKTFERTLTGTRLAETLYGETIQAFSLRELGDANRWAEIVWLNKLMPPYITDDAALVRSGVILSGSTLLVPSPKQVASSSIDPDLVFERDCQLTNKLLTDDGAGDFSLVAGRPNLKQQIVHRLVTQKGDLIRHPEYGNSAGMLVGKINGPIAGVLAGEYVRSALLSDFRVSKVSSVSATVSGDKIAIDAEVVPISGRPVEISLGV